jgi:hypothetical protein
VIPYARTFRVWTAIGLCGLVSSSALSQENLPVIIKRVEPSTVAVLTYDANGEAIAVGSGFFIDSNGDVITNYHVVQGASLVQVKTVDGRVYHVAGVSGEDKEGDLVRLSVDIPTYAVRPLSVTTSVPEVGERIVVIGNPLGYEHTVSDGIVSAIRDVPDHGKIIQITAPISRGSSGSPVVNMRGEVIGVATLKAFAGENLNFAIPGERVAALGPINRNQLSPKPARTTEEFTTPAEQLYSMGLDFVAKGQYASALSSFEKAVKKNFRYAEAHFQIGDCNVKLGHLEAAIKAYKEAVRIKPDYADAHYNLGITYASMGDKSLAFQEYRVLRGLNQELAIKLFNHISKGSRDAAR